MRTLFARIASILIAITAISHLHAAAAATDLTAGMQEGAPAMKSIGPIEFGPNGILFAADARSAAIFAISTGDTTARPNATAVKVEGINSKIAALLGVPVEQVQITDVTVNPVSKTPYLAVMRGLSADAIPVLVRVSAAGEPQVVSLDRIRHSMVSLPNAPADGAATGRGQSPRQQSITDLAFVDGRLIVAGLSNEEFASTLRSIDFPFRSADKGTAVEIYHGNHGAFETRAPVRTFTPYTVNGQKRVYAAYTCTPLVDFAMSELVPGAKVTGKTIAELGNGNTPLDMIVYQKDGKDYLLMANDRRGVMKIATENFSKAAPITARVPGTSHEGIAVENLADWTGILHLTSLDTRNALVLQRGAAAGSLNLDTRALP